MALSTWAGNAILDALLNNTALQKTAYASLHSADPALIGSNELSGNNYARVAPTLGASSGGTTDNTALTTFPTASGNWTQATYYGLWDQLAVGGNFLGGAILSVAQTILSAEYGEFAIGAMDLAVNTLFGSTTLDNIINALYRNVALQVTQAYLSLHSADPAGTGANELAHSNAYERAAAPFGAAAAKSCANDAVIDLPIVTGSNWAEATHMGLWTSGTYGAGTFIWGKQLTAARTVQVGKFFRSAIGSVVVNIT